MRIIFLGTPAFAIPALDEIVNSKHEVIAVVTQPDKPNSRGNKIVESEVKTYAKQHNIPCYQFVKISRDGIDEIKKLSPDLMITCAYGQILSQAVIDIPRYGIINIHASLLPKYRGASPIQSAVIAGETKTGITIMQTDIGLDTGDIISQKELDILPNETAGELSVRLAKLSANMILDAIDAVADPNFVKEKQNLTDATFTKKISKEDCSINWNKSALQIKNLILGANPEPIANSVINGNVMKIYTAKVAEISSDIEFTIGEILPNSSAKNGVFVQTGNGILLLGDVQLPGGKIMDAKLLMSGRKIGVGDVFETYAKIG